MWDVSIRNHFETRQQAPGKKTGRRIRACLHCLWLPSFLSPRLEREGSANTLKGRLVSDSFAGGRKTSLCILNSRERKGGEISSCLVPFVATVRAFPGTRFRNSVLGKAGTIAQRSRTGKARNVAMKGTMLLWSVKSY
eukprot:3012218-Rhodomonas_salina.1